VVPLQRFACVIFVFWQQSAAPLFSEAFSYRFSAALANWHNLAAVAVCSRKGHERVAQPKFI
jgi:hypothetical protein